MKRIFTLALVSLVLGGCVVVPAGRYDGDGYRERGYYRGERYRDEGQARRGYRGGSDGYYRGDDYYRGYYGYPYRDHSQ